MIYPENIEIKLGFDKIRELVRSYCLSELGISQVENVKFLNDAKQIERLLLQTGDFKKILVSQDNFPSTNYIDISTSLGRIKVVGSYLDEQEMYNLTLSLQTVLSCVRFFQIKGEMYPHLHQISSLIDFDPDLHKALASKFDDAGSLKDNASKELARIRSEISALDQKLRKLIDGLLQKAKGDAIAPADAAVSIRDGRLVIPILAENKRKVKGVVQDESATGHTVYIEPTQAIEVNNRISELRHRERREIILILTQLSDLIRPQISALLKANTFLGTMDFIRAKAKLAVNIDAVVPIISSEKATRFLQARHPILLLHHQKIGKPIIPLDIQLNADQRIVVISGPNAGGKSVSLKTVGLLQYMFQCGLMIPAREGTEMTIFRDLFIDIGDEQSIENDLSTYSSHLKNLKYFVDNAGSGSLFLIDEFGTGTEPQFGGAIAEVILMELNKMKCFGVVTTHYSNLKKVAEKSEGIENAAMKFDRKRLQPLYQLEIGKPGSSFALEIAQGIGFDKQMLEKARDAAGHSLVNFDLLIAELESEKDEYKAKLEKAIERSNWLEQEIRDYSDLKEDIEKRKKDILAAAKREAESIILKTNKTIERTIREIKEVRADKAKTRTARKKLETHLSEIRAHTATEETVSSGTQKIPTPGDQVKIAGHDSFGEVISIKGKKAEVLIGSLKSLVDLGKLEVIAKGEGITYNRTAKVRGINYEKRAANFSSDLDLRGKRVEEAISQLDPFLDEALLLGQYELRIIHGKGNGVLREAIRNYLKDYDYIQNIKDEHVERGGAGVSVIKLK